MIHIKRNLNSLNFKTDINHLIPIYHIINNIQRILNWVLSKINKNKYLVRMETRIDSLWNWFKVTVR